MTGRLRILFSIYYFSEFLNSEKKTNFKSCHPCHPFFMIHILICYITKNYHYFNFSQKREKSRREKNPRSNLWIIILIILVFWFGCFCLL